MVKTCANPACAAPFLYWRGGKLFRFDVKAPYEPCLDVPEQICELKPSRSSVFFWLCKNCCSTMVLSFDQHRGLDSSAAKEWKARSQSDWAERRAKVQCTTTVVGRAGKFNWHSHATRLKVDDEDAFPRVNREYGRT